ncbi:MAG: hypothetical protein ACRC33_02430 [Gemmataceae bacterium]
MTPLLLLAALAQPAPLPARAPSPLLHVRFAADGGRVTFYQGKAPPRPLPAPVTVGMRPGYVYRMRLDVGGVALYPTFEIHGALQLNPKLCCCDFPVPVNLSPEDVAAAAAGGMVTKVYYLEHPDKAVPTATKPGEVIEHDFPRAGNILHEARTRGRVMAVMHVGGREPLADELAMVNVPGTILFPGQKSVGPALAPPVLMMATWPFFDPRVGPRPPEEECLHDGGDRGLKAGFDVLGRLTNVDPEDTVAEWTDSQGRRHVVCSNRVCVCVPRYLALRKLIPVAGADGMLGPIASVQSKRGVEVDGRMPVRDARAVKPPLGVMGTQKPAEDRNATPLGMFTQLKVLKVEQLDLGPVEFVGRKEVVTLRKDEHLVLLKGTKLVADLSGVKGPAAMDSSLGTSVVARVKGGPQVVEGVLTLRDLTACCCEPAPLPPDRPLALIKCADKACAQVGDVVTFSLKYTNVGGRPLTDVAVTDSLSGRLEYVEGSTQTDREAVFTATENEAGSSLLRWEVGGTLQPGESGRIKFKVRVR